MIFQDNVIKEYLKNVYFITGTPCGGKTTISRELAKRHNLLVYDIDEQFSNHQKISNAVFQPSMNKVFKDADEFFGRTVEEYQKWLIDNTREQLDFVLLDLICLSRQYTVAVPEVLILQGISGRESLFYTGFTRFEMGNFYTELRASLTY